MGETGSQNTSPQQRSSPPSPPTREQSLPTPPNDSRTLSEAGNESASPERTAARSVTIKSPACDSNDTGLGIQKDEKATARDEDAKRRVGILRRELTRMKEKEENQREKLRAERKENKRKAVEKMRRERVEKGVTICPEAATSKQKMSTLFTNEERLSLQQQQRVLKSETEGMKGNIDQKLGISALPKGSELVKLAEDFLGRNHVANEHLPPHILAQLTTAEIDDFRTVFELFDTKNKGYITADDLQRVAGMLGYTSKKKVFKEMIQHTSKDKRGRVNFANFLDLVIRLQGDGPDPYEDIQRAFRQMDRGQKGYLTMSDLRVAAEELKLSLSNNALREMMTEADRTGDGKITIDEFCTIIKETGRFVVRS
ncbi:uncharacterized protein LOC101864017 [Aplysia californica]|uniref:Uncharacterized protein LOC101864017 n=1 Tax=Aplysia californica TaxID=6500 RepID=A0ABM1A918_APLCA|nr:uncharacterized protein LOC101864017 [Aplysia californica]